MPYIPTLSTLIKFSYSRIAARESIKMRDRHWGDRGYVTGTVGPRGDAYVFEACTAMTPDEAEEYHLRQGRIHKNFCSLYAISTLT